MFTPEQHRAEVANYTESGKQGNAPNEMHKFLRHKQSLTMLADNEQWLADNHDNLANNLDKPCLCRSPVWPAKRLHRNFENTNRSFPPQAHERPRRDGKIGDILRRIASFTREPGAGTSWRTISR